MDAAIKSNVYLDENSIHGIDGIVILKTSWLLTTQNNKGAITKKNKNLLFLIFLIRKTPIKAQPTLPIL